MSVEIKYKGNTIASASTDTTKTIKTSGKYCEADIEVINTQDGGITPGGSIEITENDTYDVTQYAEAVVNVSGGSGYEMHTVNFTLAQSTSVWDILPIYADECSDWVIYPADASNTQLSTIAMGAWWRSGRLHAQGYGRFKDIVTPTGATLTDFTHYYNINDQAYNNLRYRGNVNNKPAGDYVLKFYGIAK